MLRLSGAARQTDCRLRCPRHNCPSATALRAAAPALLHCWSAPLGTRSPARAVAGAPPPDAATPGPTGRRRVRKTAATYLHSGDLLDGRHVGRGASGFRLTSKV